MVGVARLRRLWGAGWLRWLGGRVPLLGRRLSVVRGDVRAVASCIELSALQFRANSFNGL